MQKDLDGYKKRIDALMNSTYETIKTSNHVRINSNLIENTPEPTIDKSL